MSVSDQDFREAFKPLYIPAHYDAADVDQNRIIYALAQLGEATSAAVAKKLHELDSTVDAASFGIVVESVLNGLFEKGLLNGADDGGGMHYNLSKITEANDGAVNPDLLAPGLD
jgi:hypothetical protein